jgi:hypothetical protein
MATALRTTTQVRADLARALHRAGRMTVVDEEYPDVHGELDRLCEELAMLERAD